jgi:hypothetical protein
LVTDINPLSVGQVGKRRPETAGIVTLDHPLMQLRFHRPRKSGWRGGERPAAARALAVEPEGCLTVVITLNASGARGRSAGK